jgi:hypothetical protein
VIYSENETVTPNDPGDPASSFGQIKFVPGKDVVKVKLKCTNKLDYSKPKYTGPNELEVGNSGNGEITFENNGGKITVKAKSSNPKLLQILDPKDTVLHGETAKIPLKITCPDKVLSSTVTITITITITITNGVETKTETVNVPVTCKAKAKRPTALVSPPTIPLTVAVGSGPTTGSFTISNIGDVDSSLEYKVYNPSQQGLDLAQFNNGGSALQATSANGGSLRSQALVSTAFPGDPAIDVWAGGTISVQTSGTYTLLKSSDTNPQKSFKVTATCSSAGMHSTIIPVVWFTGDVNANGMAQAAESDISVDVTCTGTPNPIPDITNLSLVAEINQSSPDGANSQVTVTNAAPDAKAPYGYTLAFMSADPSIATLEQYGSDNGVILVNDSQVFSVKANCLQAGTTTGAMTITGRPGTSSQSTNIMVNIDVTQGNRKVAGSRNPSPI